MEQSLRPTDGTDPTYSTEDFLNAITANMVMTAGPETLDYTNHETWILKKIAMIQTALIGPAQQWYSPLPLETKITGKRFVVNFKRHLIFNNRKHKRIIIIGEHNMRFWGTNKNTSTKN